MEGAGHVGGQLRGDKECPFSGVTKCGRVWRKLPESDARSVCGYIRAMSLERLGVSAAMEAAVDENRRDPAVVAASPPTEMLSLPSEMLGASAAMAAAGAENPHNPAAAAASSLTEMALSLSSVMMGC